MLLGEPFQLGEAGHAGLVLADDLAEHARRVEAGHAGQVDTGLGVAAPLQDATLAVAERERVAGPSQVGGPGGGVDEGGDGGAPVGRRDARGRPVAVVDRDRERRPLALGVLGDHRRQVEGVEAVAGERHADDPRGVVEEEGDLVGGGVLGRHDEVALVLAVGIVDHDHHLARPDGSDGVLDVSERHDSILP